MNTVPQLLPPRAAYGAVGRARFKNLFRIAQQTVAILPWEGRLHELSLRPDQVEASVKSGENLPGNDWTRVFDPFVGHWVGGDLHDASRAFQHLWHPATVDGELLAQPVMMISSADPASPLMAYNFAHRADDLLELTGVVGQRAHVGFLIDQGAVLWFGEEPDGWTSVHAERIWARNQLYDIRGLVFRLGPDGIQESLASDWRYHRVAPGAIEVDIG